MRKVILPLFAILTLMLSCSDGKTKNTTIVFNGAFAKKHDIKIDDTITVSAGNYEGFDKLVISSGKHKLSIDGKVQEFTAEGEEGVLNIAAEEFVIFPRKYTYGKDPYSSMSSFGNPNGIILNDSIIAASVMFIKGAIAGNYTREAYLKLGNGSEKTELLKIPGTTLFIAKNWDYGMTDGAPRSVQEGVSEGTTSSHTYRKQIMNADGFITHAATTGSFFVATVAELVEQ